MSSNAIVTITIFNSLLKHDYALSFMKVNTMATALKMVNGSKLKR